MILKKHLSTEQGLPDLLNYAHFVGEGVLINKDGAFLTTYRFSGPDISAMGKGELDALAANFNRMACCLEDGWMLHVDEVRAPSVAYPAKSAFPDSISALIDEERRQCYEAEGAHYENRQFLTFVWKFPLPLVKTTRHWFVEGLPEEEKGANLSTLLAHYCALVERCVGLLRSSLILARLNNAELLGFLGACISSEWLPIAVPPDGTFIDVVLGRRCLVGGYVPRIGKRHIYVLSIIGYLNEETVPGLLEELGTYPLAYRWSNRFVPLSTATAAREIKRCQRNWHNQAKGLAGIIREAITGRPSEKTDYDALQMAQQTDEALTANSGQAVRFGYWSSEIVLMNEDMAALERAAKDLACYLEQAGFACIKEDINALDAWLGTLPGHGSCNLRRVFVHSLNLAHMLPLHTVWTGAPFAPVASLLPPGSPPVFYAATTGKTPFRFHLDVGDVGHQVVLGPTGSGKSTYLGLLIAQFLRYEGAQVFVFDKDRSHQALTVALEGQHYDMGNADALSFCPLADLSTDSKKIRAGQFIEDLALLQNVVVTPEIRAAIYQALEALANGPHGSHRNLTVFCATVQNEIVRAALRYYTLEGPIKLLDATEGNLNFGHLQVFEMNWLLAQKPEITLPILRYLFDQIESKLEENRGQRPTLIILEEAWLYLSHEVFSKKIKEWLKVLRKKNARVVFATQSLADLYDPSTQSLTATTAAILESCPTKIYLPHPTMEAEIKVLYQKMGLSERQLEIIMRLSTPKRHYYLVTPEGNRLIELGFHDVKPMALAFIGLSQEKGRALVNCKKQHGKEWAYYWLKQAGFSEWAEHWREHYCQKASFEERTA